MPRTRVDVEPIYVAQTLLPSRAQACSPTSSSRASTRPPPSPTPLSTSAAPTGSARWHHHFKMSRCARVARRAGIGRADRRACRVPTRAPPPSQARQLMRAMMAALRHTKRTNAYVPSRYAFALRLDGSYFRPALPPAPPDLDNTPYGVFFVAGRQFNGYHVRFRDVARGGCRLVAPPTAEAHTTESRRHFAECYNLAWAQQVAPPPDLRAIACSRRHVAIGAHAATWRYVLTPPRGDWCSRRHVAIAQLKNKDIPEGGSKAVVLLAPVPSDGSRAQRLHAAFKAFTDSLLDLVTPAERVRARTRQRRRRARDLGVSRRISAYFGRAGARADPQPRREGDTLPRSRREHNARRHQLGRPPRGQARLPARQCIHVVETGIGHQSQGARRESRRPHAPAVPRRPRPESVRMLRA